MAVQGPIPVEFAHVFPHGAFAAGPFEPVRDFDASKGDRFVQAKDKHTGQPLWAVEVIDADPAARDKTVKIKVAAPAQPALPAPPPGMPFVPVEFTGLTVTPYVNQAGRLAYSLKAAGVRVPSRGGRGAEARTARHERRLHLHDDHHPARRADPITVSFHLDAAAWLVVPGAGTDQPYLKMSHGDVSVRIGPRTDEVTSEDATIARNLANQAVTYAAEIERLPPATRRTGPGGTAA